MSQILTDTWHGPMWVLEEDVGVSRCLREYGEYSLLELEVMKKHIFPDSVVMDVGANIGGFTIPLAKLCKKVYAVEPQAEVVEVLEKNIALAGVSNVEVLPFALGFQQDQLFYTPDPQGAGSVQMKTKGSNSVQTVSLDSLDVVPDFIKLDVEGMELEVLAGGLAMLQARRPYLFAEYWPDDNGLLQAFTVLGYCSSMMSLPIYVPNNWKNNPTNHYPNMAHLMMLGVPNQKNDAK